MTQAGLPPRIRQVGAGEANRYWRAGRVAGGTLRDVALLLFAWFAVIVLVAVVLSATAHVFNWAWGLLP